MNIGFVTSTLIGSGPDIYTVKLITSAVLILLLLTIKFLSTAKSDLQHD